MKMTLSEELPQGRHDVGDLHSQDVIRDRLVWAYSPLGDPPHQTGV